MSPDLKRVDQARYWIYRGMAMAVSLYLAGLLVATLAAQSWPLIVALVPGLVAGVALVTETSRLAAGFASTRGPQATDSSHST